MIQTLILYVVVRTKTKTGMNTRLLLFQNMYFYSVFTSEMKCKTLNIQIQKTQDVSARTEQFQQVLRGET